jgi:hypothetical protein
MPVYKKQSELKLSAFSQLCIKSFPSRKNRTKKNLKNDGTNPNAAHDSIILSFWYSAVYTNNVGRKIGSSKYPSNPFSPQ